MNKWHDLCDQRRPLHDNSRTNGSAMAFVIGQTRNRYDDETARRAQDVDRDDDDDGISRPRNIRICERIPSGDTIKQAIGRLKPPATEISSYTIRGLPLSSIANGLLKDAYLPSMEVKVYSRSKNLWLIAKAVVDTASSHNWISQELVNSLAPAKKAIHAGFTSSNFQSRKRPVSSKVRLQWQSTGTQVYSDSFLVAAEWPFDLILGHDILFHLSAIQPWGMSGSSI